METGLDCLELMKPELIRTVWSGGNLELIRTEKKRRM